MPEANKSLSSDTRSTNQGAFRLFFIDKESRQPVTGLVINIFLDSPGAADSKRQPASFENSGQLLATLQTDQAGYVSGKFDRSSVAANSHLVVTHAGKSGNALVLKVDDLLNGNDIYTIQIDASDYVGLTTHLGLPSIMSPDAKDLKISPGSIGHVPHLAPRGSLCSQLMPTTMSVRRFEAFVIKADICHPITVNCGNEIQMVRGTMLEYEIAWNPMGTALGDLLNTITLAPCEQVNIAIADWQRREIASQSQAIDIQQQSFQEINHDRLIVETMQSSISNKGSSWSVAGSLGLGRSSSAGATFSGSGLGLNLSHKLDLTAAFGGGYAKSKSVQNLALNTTSQLSEHISQAASSVYSQRSTLVFQATASEHQTYQTRTLRNNNHCHALTFMYYQVNRNYEVVTDFKGEREVVLVKFDNSDFDANRAYCNAELLKAALLDQSLINCFDELADALFCCELTPVSPPTGQKLLMDSLTLTVKPREVGGFWGITIVLHSATGQQPLAWIGPTSPNPHWMPGGVHTQTFNLQTHIDPAQVAWIEIQIISGTAVPASVLLNEIKITYHAVGDGDFILFSSQAQTSISPSLSTPVQPQLPGQPPVVANKNECVEKSCRIQKLLGHLNCHKRYYNSILGFNEVPNERVMRWSCCLADEPFNLIAQIENDPIAVYGDFLVFPAAGSQLEDNPDVLSVSNLVTMPTPGVYAEGILGQCGTCEKIDPDKFWNWKDSPCPDNAPSVGPPPAPQTGGPKDLKADAISNLITFANVPDAPDSVLKDLVSSLVSKADSGSAEAKSLLDNLLQKLLEKIK